MEQVKNRIEWIDIAKGLTIILIVFGHIYENEIMHKILWSFHLQTFMFISGYLYKKRSNMEYIKRKIKTIMIPYLFFGILELIYFYLIESRFRENFPIQKSIIGLLTGNYDGLVFNVHLWYLPFLFITSVLYNIINNIFKNPNYSRTIFIILGIIGIFVEIPNLPFSINKIDLMLYFSLGEISNNVLIIENILKKQKKAKLRIISIVSIIFAIILNLLKWNQYGMQYIIGLLGITSIIMIAYLIQESKNNIKYNIAKKLIISKLKNIGMDTLIVLCIHGPIYRALIKLFSMILKQGTNYVRTQIILSLIITFIDIEICLFVYRILKRYMPWSIGKGKRRNNHG